MCASKHPTDETERRCEPSCSLEAREIHCSWCACALCDFCVRAARDARAEWLPLPAGTTVQAASSLEAKSLRCPPPRGCSFRLRPTNVAGWVAWSLGSGRVTTPLLPPPPHGALRLELRLVRPFSRVAAVLEGTLLEELSAALGVASTRLQLSGLRLEAEYVVITLLPPDAFGLAVRLRALLRSPPAALRSGRASRSIDVAAGLTLLLSDGTAEPFAPPEEASTWAGLVSSLLGGGGGGGGGGGSGGGGNGTRLVSSADAGTGATRWVRLSAAVGVLVAAAAALVARGRRRQRDAAGRGVEEESQGFLSLGTAEGGVQRSEREGGKLMLGENGHSRVDLRF